MKVYLINGKKIKRRFGVLLTCMAFLLTVTVFFSAVEGYFIDKLVSVSTTPETGVIIIDAGHGGEDVGATGVNGVYEKDLNLIFANLVGKELESRGYKVVYTRTDDKLLYTEQENIKGIRKISDLKNRCKIADEHKGALFISIHMNTFGAAKYSGLQVYYSNGSEKSINLATAIQSTVRERLQNDNKRAVKNGKGLYILDKCSATSVIVECGFLSNPDECAKLSEKEYQKELSFAIVCGIIEYIDGSNASNKKCQLISLTHSDVPKFTGVSVQNKNDTQA